ncbi:IclR family transcriptional regulator [Blastococcus tunisiensis]|uniref:IclR family transcriptional regulator n=1 Tax=Blastococcus tunisiensis TaxID=1798228 RepID=UPI001C31512B|nr:IclR family transcriptional regulator [Blastococcus sp. DSM 46838]
MTDVLDPASVLGKAIIVLNAFAADDTGVAFAELQRRTSLPKATLHRVAGDLVKARLLVRIDGDYHLGSHLFELGMRASVERTLLEVATPFIEDLYERTHETVHLGLREGAQVVYVAKIGGHRQAPSPSRIGGRMPVHATAIGKALLAWADEDERTTVLSGRLERLTPRTITAPGRLRQQLDSARENGVAFEYEESAVGLVCVASPVLDTNDRPIAAISVTGAVTRFRPADQATLVRAAAAGVAATLARRGRLGEPLA